jgi:hypothetical protein
MRDFWCGFGNFLLIGGFLQVRRCDQGFAWGIADACAGRDPAGVGGIVKC